MHQHNFPRGAKGYVEASWDQGDSWQLLAVFEGDWAEGTNMYPTVTGYSLWVRYTVESTGGDGFWEVWDVDIIGDTSGEPPKSTYTISGIPCNECFCGSVTISITATDIMGVREVHCVDNEQRKEFFNYRDRLYFTITTNGYHRLPYWAVDNAGNEAYPEFTHSFCIYTGSPPRLDIVTPESGLYYFGKKVLSIDKTIIIGGFTITVNASDAESDLYRVVFFLDNKEIGEDIDEPFTHYCARKHSGEGKIRAVAEDLEGNNAADSLEIYYFNLF
jgi:hypothetical protein